ncbi:MAG: helix-turn-helix domain-containing protein [Solirubrobacterales bacterium]
MDELLAGDLPVWQRERAMGVRLMALGRPNQDVAEIVGRHENTVGVWRREYAQRGIESITEPRGGRRNQVMDEAAEQAFVEGFAKAAERGEPVTANIIHEALIKQTGQEVWPSTVYRTLERNGWRRSAIGSSSTRDCISSSSTSPSSAAH